MNIFWIGLIVGAMAYALSALVIGSKAPVAHYLLVLLVSACAFIVWVVGDMASEALRSFCGGFWIICSVFILIRFGSSILPKKEKKTIKYVK